MTIPWFCRECDSENDMISCDCENCGTQGPTWDEKQNRLLLQEVRELTACLNEMRLSLGKAWVMIDSLKARVESLESRVDVLDDESCVTVTEPPVFLRSSWFGVTHD